eukprot:scaffold30993_cov50-Cyclotella_meneghiniana.AAC.4
MNETSTPLLSQALDDLELEPEYHKKGIKSNNIQSNEHKHHSWLIPFLVNIFLSCASFSIVQPSLAGYLNQIGAPLSCLPWVVSLYSIGEMLGSVAIGSFYEYAVKSFKVLGRGPRCSSAMYATAGWMEDTIVAISCIISGRVLRGIWTGGQQAVERAYLSAAVAPSVKVEYTAILTTFVVLGFVMGPTIGALFCEIDATMFGLPVNANNAPGFLILVANIIGFIQTFLFFDGKDDRSGITSQQEDERTYTLESSTKSNESSLTLSAGTIRQKEDEETDNIRGSSTESNVAIISYSDKKLLFNTVGVIMCNFFFLVHYYSFAVQETITAPMVVKLYDWSPVQINMLFIGAGIDIPQIERVLPMYRFILGFSLSTMAFPIGMSVVLGLYSNILAPVNQGRWMGVIFAVSAVPRALGPFLALEALEAVDWRTWLEFGLCSLFFLIALVGAISTLSLLAPYSEFVASIPTHENINSPGKAKLVEEVSFKECQ